MPEAEVCGSSLRGNGREEGTDVRRERRQQPDGGVDLRNGFVVLWFNNKWLEKNDEFRSAESWNLHPLLFKELVKFVGRATISYYF